MTVTRGVVDVHFVQADSLYWLKNQIVQCLKEGWHLHGNLAFSAQNVEQYSTDDGCMRKYTAYNYTQTLVKYGELENEKKLA